MAPDMYSPVTGQTQAQSGPVPGSSFLPKIAELMLPWESWQHTDKHLWWVPALERFADFNTKHTLERILR